MKLEDQKVYPTWRYHKDHEPRLIKDREELEALGSGWVDNPGKVDLKPEAKAEKKPEPAPAPEPKPAAKKKAAKKKKKA